MSARVDWKADRGSRAGAWIYSAHIGRRSALRSDYEGMGDWLDFAPAARYVDGKCNRAEVFARAGDGWGGGAAVLQLAEVGA